jgi:outer membrane protein TolC
VRVPFRLLCLLAAGCSPAAYAADADAEVDAVLAEATAKAIGGLRDRVLRPEPAQPDAARGQPEPAQPQAGQPEPGKPESGRTGAGHPDLDEPVAPAAPDPGRPPSGPAAPLQLDLATALRLGVQGNRDYLTQRESLYQQALAFTATRFEFGPQLQSTLAAVFTDRETGRGILSADGRGAVSQILPTGGFLAVDGGLGFDHFVGPTGDAWSSNAAVRLRQPLLQGAGYAVSHEAWTRAQREVVYAVRDFELFRQGFAIDVARDYFGLTSEKQTLANQERTYQDAVFDRRRAEALFRVDRITDELQVFRARRREVETENALIDARASYQRALDAFKVRLGLPTTTTLEIVDQQPEYRPIDMDDESAVRAALHNRLDLVTQREQIEDSERQLAIAENGLLPDLNLDASYGLDGSGPGFDRASPHDWSSSVGVTMELPLQRTRQRNSLRSAQIAVAQAQRRYDLQRDQVATDVRDQLRQLRSIEQQIALQREQIEQERKAVAVMQIRYESGTVDNRDLLESRQALIDAENALIRLLLDHFVRRLELHRTLGVLFIDAEGMWS